MVTTKFSLKTLLRHKVHCCVFEGFYCMIRFIKKELMLDLNSNEKTAICEPRIEI
jgi:hypothetical protein